MTNFSDRPVGLYVHIPFCPIICPYCAFYKLIWQPDKEAIFVDNLLTEIDFYYDRFGRVAVDSLYYGGGTPNVLSGDAFKRIHHRIYEKFDIKSGTEISMEMNPGPPYLDKVPFYIKEGIQRVSVGVQSFDPAVLTFYGRNHSVQDSIEFLDMLESSGITNVSIDIIFGHQDHHINQLQASLDALIKRSISHVSLYGLSIEPNTPFERQKITVDDSTQYDHYTFLQSTLSNNDYRQYEVSTFARPGLESRHNIKYLIFEPFIGLGPGAHSFFQGRRYANKSDYRQYTSFLHELVPTELQMITDQDWPDYIATRLRYKRPIYRHDILQYFQTDYFSQLAPKLREFSHMGWIDMGDDWFMISDKGCIVLDEVLCHLVLN